MNQLNLYKINNEYFVAAQTMNVAISKFNDSDLSAPSFEDGVGLCRKIEYIGKVYVV